MENIIPEIKTNASLLEVLHKLAGKKLTAREIRAQRVSFVYGFLSPTSNISHKKIKQILDEIQ